MYIWAFLQLLENMVINYSIFITIIKSIYLKIVLLCDIVMLLKEFRRLRLR